MRHLDRHLLAGFDLASPTKRLQWNRPEIELRPGEKAYRFSKILISFPFYKYFVIQGRESVGADRAILGRLHVDRLRIREPGFIPVSKRVARALDDPQVDVD